jgi:hypothetical protein
VVVVSDDQEDSGEPVGEMDDAVMSLDLQDPALRKLYKGLPVLPSIIIFSLFPWSDSMRSFSAFCDIHPFLHVWGWW